MPWAELIDAVLWLAAMVVFLVVGNIIYRRRDLPARLLLALLVVLAMVLIALYLLTATFFSRLFPHLSSHLSPLVVASLTMAIAVAAMLPLRDRLLRIVERLLFRVKPNRQQLLQGYSRVLTTLVALPRLLETVADQIEEVFYPSGLAVVLADDDTAFRVMLSRGRLATSPAWCEGACFDDQHFLPAHLATRHRPLYLPRHLGDLPAMHKPEWVELQAGGTDLLVPMHLHGKLTGWLALGPRLANLSYGRQDLDFLSAMADQSCVAFENARLYDAIQQRATELAMVAMVSSAISSSLDLEYVLQTIVESVVQVVGCDKSAIFELDEDGQELSLRMAKGLSQAYVESSLRLLVGQDARALSVATGAPLVVPDIEVEPRLAGLLALARREGYRSLIDLPLIGRGGLFGVLTVYFADVHRPSASEIEVLTTFASQAATAIENARLYAAVSRERDRATRLYEQTDAALAHRVEELTAIEEVSRQLTSTLELQRVIDPVLERAMQATHAERGVIALYEQGQHGLRLLVQSGYPPEVRRYQIEPWPDDRGITGRVARTGVTALVPDVTHDADYVPVTAETLSELGVPIIHDRTVIGVITLESDRLAAFTPEQVRFVELLARHAAIGMNNAQLFQQVTEAHDHLQAVLNSTHDVVIVQDTTGQVILANPRTAEMFGPGGAEWLWLNNPLDLGQVMASGMVQNSETDADKLIEILRRIKDRPEEAVDIAFSFDQNGSRRYVEGIASPVVSARGQVIGRVAVLRDVTHQHELEQFREEMTSMLIHDLQGPLAAVISSLEILHDDHQVDSGAPGELVRIGLGSGRKLLGRIESLLRIRQLQEKQVPLDLRTVSLRQVIQPVVQEYRPTATAANIALEVNLAAGLPPVVVDEEVIGRLFGNLLDNALKFTPAGGRIEIRASLESDTYVLCAVADSGSGIAAEAQETIFERFRRGAKPQPGRRSGTGIGLTYCRLAVEAHGGRIWVESQVGQGSTFYFTLPVGADQQA
jgi:NtrC-family two-component system sensor histidine kinase KinB